jgi:hypothetical protein
VWRQDRSALFIALQVALAKVRLPNRAEVLHFGACDLSPVPISSLTEVVTSNKLIFSFKLVFSSCPISERQNPISCPLMWSINCAPSRDRPLSTRWLFTLGSSLSSPSPPKLQLANPSSPPCCHHLEPSFCPHTRSLVCTFLVLPLREIK